MDMNGMRHTEQALIGVVLTEPERLATVSDLISPEDFSDPVAQECYLHALSLWKEGQPVDPALVMSRNVGLAAYIADSTSKGAGFAAYDYAREIREAAADRRIRQELTDILNDRNRSSENLDRILKIYQREMSPGKKNPDINKVLERFDGFCSDNQKRGSMGVKTGFRLLQELNIEYVIGHIWVVGGFTSVGKTAVMTQKICNLLSRPHAPSMLVISTEMTEHQLVTRMLSNITGVSGYRIMTRKYWDAEEEDLVARKRRVLEGAPIRIYDDIYTIDGIELAARKAQLQGGVDIIFVDYVQNCMVPDARSPYQEQAILAKRLQKLAKDVEATVICMSQVSNEVGRGATDNLEFKGAGEWAAVADLSVMLRGNKKDKYALAYNIEKNRHGPRGRVRFEYKANHTRLEEQEFIE